MNGKRVMPTTVVLVEFNASELIEHTYYLNKATGDVCCLMNWVVSFRERMELQRCVRCPCRTIPAD
jgi:hypothetical protein